MHSHSSDIPHHPHDPPVHCDRAVEHVVDPASLDGLCTIKDRLGPLLDYVVARFRPGRDAIEL